MAASQQKLLFLLLEFVIIIIFIEEWMTKQKKQQHWWYIKIQEGELGTGMGTRNHHPTEKWCTKVVLSTFGNLNKTRT